MCVSLAAAPLVSMIERLRNVVGDASAAADNVAAGMFSVTQVNAN